MFKIIKNPNEKEFDEILQDVKANEGYCPCRTRSEESKCVCKEFRESQSEGMCHCGLYQKILVENNIKIK